MFLKEYNRIEENFLQRIFPDESFAQAITSYKRNKAITTR